MTPTKSELRAQAMERRQGRNGGAPTTQLIELLHRELAPNSPIGCYLNRPGELSTTSLISQLTNQFQFYAPAVIGENLSWRKLTNEFQVGKFGIDEPSSDITIPVNQLAAVIFPALAVDLAGNRLGFGRGYFDRNLAGVTPLKLVLVYDEDIVPNVPAESHDVKVDFIATPTQIIKIQN